MICKRIESVNHLCKLFVSIKYMDNLPEETLDTAREDSSAKLTIVLTPRDELSNPAQLRAETLADGNLMLKNR